MHTKSDNIETIMRTETNDIIEKLFESLLQKYQEGLKESMRGSGFIPDSVNLLYYHLQKLSLKRGGWYVDSPKWLKNKKATTNSKNNDDNCFHYTLTVALNYQNIKKDPQRISKIKLIIDQYNWKKIHFPSHSKDLKRFEQNHKTIALNILSIPHNM